MSIPLAGMNMVSRLLQPFNPFVRYLYKSLKMLNNFPEDLAVEVPHAHQKLLDLFDYNPLTLEEEIKARYTL